MSAPLISPEGALQQHFATMETILRSGVDQSARPRLVVNWQAAPLTANLDGEGCERISRNRGPDTPVAPILLIRDGLWAWLGYREEWNIETPAGKTRRFSFRSASLTIHLGYRGMQHKPQMFRTEWAGWARWNGNDYSYQAGTAGHPHWQFDAVESLREQRTVERAADYLQVLQQEQADVPAREFMPNPLTAEETGSLVSGYDLSRMHFASAAAWWKKQPDSTHAHTPASTSEVRSWMGSALKYISSELSRL